VGVGRRAEAQRAARAPRQEGGCRWDSRLRVPAPVCVAKGADNIALKIREIAHQHDIPIVENVPLARALYATVEIDDEPGGALSCGRRNYRLRDGSAARAFRPAV